jgi:hypothetical protein
MQVRHRAHTARLYPAPAQLQTLDRQVRDARSRPLPGWEWLAQLPAQASQLEWHGAELSCSWRHKAAAQGGRLVKVAAPFSSQTDVPPLAAPPRGTGRLDVEPSPLGGL